MNIELIYNTPLSIMAQAGRTAWNSFHKGGIYPTPTDNITDVDHDFLDRVINKHRHGSVSEHISYNFKIDGISRACLQELARHRIASLTVKSSRYTLKELIKEEPFTDFNNRLDFKRAQKYIVETGNHNVDITAFFMLEDLRMLVQEGISNDLTKYAMPESYKTSLVWTINARALRNFLELRSKKSALWEIQEVANNIYNSLPDAHKFLYEGIK